jgi:hypothetical protein
MDARAQQILSLTVLIAVLGYFAQSFSTAEAYPQGPNVSRGTNPVEAFSINCNSTTPTMVTTGNEKFIITDVVVANGGSTEDVTMYLNGSEWIRFPEMSMQSFNSGFPVPPNSTLTCYAYYSKRTIITGYYAHP